MMTTRTFIPLLALLAGYSTAACDKGGTNPTAGELRPESPASDTLIAAKLPAPVPSAKTETGAQGKADATDPSERWIVVEQSEMYRVVDQVGQDLYQAVYAYAEEEDQATAALELEKAGKDLVSEIDGMNSTAAGKLKEASNELVSAASDLRAQKLDSAGFYKVVSNAYASDVEQRWLLVSNKEWVPYYAEPDRHFRLAEDALGTDAKRAATELAKVASYVRLQAYRASGLSRSRLDHVVEALTNTAKNLFAGKAVSADDFNALEYDTAHELAYFHYHQAIDAWETAQSDRTKHDVKAALHHMKNVVAKQDDAARADGEKMLLEMETWSDTLQDTLKSDVLGAKQKLSPLEDFLKRTKQAPGHSPQKQPSSLQPKP